MGISVDEDANKVFVLAKVIDNSLLPKINAKKWIDEIAPLINGKGGGKDNQAQATGDLIDKVPDVVKAAENFAKLSIQ